MALTEQTFFDEMTALAERFGREPSREMFARYFEAVSHLDDATFLRASAHIYAHDTFWPAPVRFEEAAKDARRALESDLRAKRSDMYRDYAFLERRYQDAIARGESDDELAERVATIKAKWESIRELDRDTWSAGMEHEAIERVLGKWAGDTLAKWETK